MSKPVGDHIKLVLDWRDLGETAGLRRNTVGFSTIKRLAKDATSAEPLVINAFLYAFLCPAKNLDLFLIENLDAISDDLTSIEEKMRLLGGFERDATGLPDPGLRDLYLAARNMVARRSARDEQRTLATLLFSGPSTVEQIAHDLGIGENLAGRVLRVLGPVVEEQGTGMFVLRSDTDTLAVVLRLLRSTLGLNPVRVLRRRIIARNPEVLS